MEDLCEKSSLCIYDAVLGRSRIGSLKRRTCNASSTTPQGPAMAQRNYATANFLRIGISLPPMSDKMLIYSPHRWLITCGSDSWKGLSKVSRDAQEPSSSALMPVQQLIHNFRHGASPHHTDSISLRRRGKTQCRTPGNAKSVWDY